ncbi:MAG: polyketide synthase, partial [Chloroflexota bacterium]|nr:polyketide synthase [Chloroflexota bacterium]
MEPIAIIGIGCRFPQADNPEAFWKLLRNGVDAISEVPAERWDVDEFYDPDPTVLGKMNTRWAGFLDGVDRFDPYFFGISPREAASMDPQQRLLLEVAWEALEDAGQVLDDLAGRPVGVFVGISTNDYRLEVRDPIYIDAYLGTGVLFSIAAGRISYLLNFRGPALAIDTACSSSLVAVHLACQSLQSGETELALAAGVNVILDPGGMIALTQLTALSPDGRCKVFDAQANGYVRGEGAGVVVLKRLEQALADGDPIYAVIRGSAVNHDGRSNGLTAPNGPSQEALIRHALDNAGVSPAQISYVEAHGTGTPLGDPIETMALGAVLAQERPSGSDCAIGSVKSNIGHLEAAAGIASLIKVALSLKHG